MTVRTGTVKLSTVAALDGKPLNAGYLLRVKERLDVRGAQETPDEVREESAHMCYEAMDRAERAKVLRARGNALLDEAAAEIEEAEALTNTNRQTINRRMGF
ncbi:hypothetical protein GOB57_24115 [Sinorhizobium meliloti]|nr:hypothetical protein [Sinorhizobium meliloti]